MDYEINAKGNFAQEQEKNAKATEKVADEFKKLQKASAELEKAQMQWLNRIQTPQEKYNKQIEQLNKLQEAGKITDTERAKAIKLCQDQLERSTKTVPQMREQNDVLAGQITKWASVATAIDVARRAFQAYSDLGKEYEGGKAEQDVALGRLQQIAKNQEDYNRMKSSAQRFAETGNVSMAEGLRTINVLENIGAADSADFIAKLRKSEFVGEFGSQLAPGIKAVQSNVEGAGDLKKILATALGAAKTSSLDLEPTLQYMSKVGAASKSFGFGLEEVAALTSAGQTGVGKGEGGATAIESFLSETRTKGVFKPGMTVPELVAANRNTQYGSHALEGFNALASAQGAANYEAALAEARTASAQGESYVLPRAEYAANADAGFAARQEQRGADVRLERAMEPYTTNRATTATGYNEARARVAGNTVATVGAKIGSGVADALNAGEAASYGITSSFAILAQTGMGNSPTALLRSIRDLLASNKPKAPPLQTGSP